MLGCWCCRSAAQGGAVLPSLKIEFESVLIQIYGLTVSTVLSQRAWPPGDVQALDFATPYYLVKKDPSDISIDDIESAPNQMVQFNGAQMHGTLRRSCFCRHALLQI